MGNRFINTIVFVKDIVVSKEFYSNILGIKIVRDLGAIVFLENNLVLHDAESILKTVYGVEEKIAQNSQGKRNLLLYFECEDLKDLKNYHSQIKNKVEIIHNIELREWGQNVFRFYDPDGHIVELGEPYAQKR